ncbi:hypothetical protein OSH11_17030 [Kaistia dalseonensis]|uniref:Chromosome segregation ATPase n=1 Tax=Kaistia dalseonensis TaxID=410840 RepID=A0ABU0HBZ1_9HYPH|nr:hypothetical protein [Kaistia dalseonensis]MCX5496413.1 hypothetical protein [Kaistia dalseonensis]MDQ0439034.1 chromosome segregation ATPase [Kaistia dalseonensis]
MIEAVMYYALGFLSAALAVLIFAPPFWRRAVRLNHRAIEQTLPMTHAEIQAEKDHIRASFAVSVRQMAVKIERLEEQVAEQLIEINRKREIITHLTAEGSMSAEDMIALEKQRDELLQTVVARDAAVAKAKDQFAQAERRVAEIEAKLTEAGETIEKMVAERETQRLEIVARDTELDNLRDAVAAVKTTSTVGAVARAGLETEMSEIRAGLAMERRKAEESIDRAADIEAKHVAALAQLAARDSEIEGVRDELQTARNRIDELSLRLVEAEATGMSILAIKEDKAEMEARLSQLEARNERLEAEAAERKAAEATLSDAETALLRGKLIEIGAAVARLASPPSLPRLVTDASTSKGSDDEPPAGEATTVSLAERIRALQHAGSGL